MGRQDWPRKKLSCALGINEQEDLSRLDQCSDARNVWAPAGELEQRPGYEGVFYIPSAYIYIGGAPASELMAAIEDAATGTVTGPADTSGGALAYGAADKQAGDRVYLAYNRAVAFQLPVAVWDIAFTGANANQTLVQVEYWNGSEWRHVTGRPYSMALAGANSPTYTYNYWQGSAGVGAEEWLFVVPPRDWTAHAPFVTDAVTRYWLRLTYQNAALSAAATHVNAGWREATTSTTKRILGMFGVQYSTTKRVLVHQLNAAGTSFVQADADAMPPQQLFTYNMAAGNAPPYPASVAVVSDFDEAFVACTGRVYRAAAFPTGETADNTRVATVEDRDFAVGPGAPYDPAFIVTEGAFPPAEHILYSNNRLWAAYGTTMRWGAPAPYHKVWPTISTSPLVENDNSPISGLAALGENVVVYKGDSIWMMVYSGENAIAPGTSDFTPTRIVDGVGCVAGASIQSIRGTHVFLDEEGIMQFDGTPGVRLATQDKDTGADRLADTIRSITPARRPFAVSAHWKKYNAYLLAVSVNGSAVNNLVIVWDYRNDTWWLWDDIEAESFLVDEGAGDEERLYFADSTGRVFELGVGNLDNGAAIESYFITHELGLNDNRWRTLKEVRVRASNRTRSVSIEVMPNAAPSGSSENKSFALNFTDRTEAEYDTAVYDTDKYVFERSRDRKSDQRLKCYNYKVKVSHAADNSPMSISNIELAELVGSYR